MYTSNETSEAEIRKKTSLYSSTTSTQHSIGSPSHNNQTRKGNERHQIGKEEATLSLFEDDMTMYIENSTDSTNKPLSIISEFGKEVG